VEIYPKEVGKTRAKMREVEEEEPQMV